MLTLTETETAVVVVRRFVYDPDNQDLMLKLEGNKWSKKRQEHRTSTRIGVEKCDNG